ncbi:DUF262 domain-containing protein [Caulobacter sp. CCNWLY153]|uniref:DUF262 domain-containing protein n=1 Tax=unclassified Caulobacter TaxID=2648921 RepID=UPI002FF0C0F8
MKNFESRVYSISDFLEWHQNGLLDLSPSFQRRSVWTRAAKSYLIDTIVRGRPMPKILITQELTNQKTIRTVVDGQQRLRAILEFFEGSFAILKSHNDQYGRKTYAGLPEDAQSQILSYSIGVDVLYNAKLNDLLDIFARINTYSVALNTQEKLNAKYLGPFKIISYSLGHKYAEYFKEGKIITPSAVSRMAEAELSSDLLMSLSDGIQTSKNIEKTYKKYEPIEEIPEPLSGASERFEKVMSFIGAIYDGKSLSQTNWSRVHWFYTLFNCVSHGLYGDVVSDVVGAPRLSSENIVAWRSALSEISAQYDLYTTEKDIEIPRAFADFIDFSRRRTTDTDARLARARFVLKQIAA